MRSLLQFLDRAGAEQEPFGVTPLRKVGIDEFGLLGVVELELERGEQAAALRLVVVLREALVGGFVVEQGDDGAPRRRSPVGERLQAFGSAIEELAHAPVLSDVEPSRPNWVWTELFVARQENLLFVARVKPEELAVNLQIHLRLDEALLEQELLVAREELVEIAVNSQQIGEPCHHAAP